MTEQYLDAVVVGAGFGGLYALRRLKQMGLSVRAYEAGGGVGGTWYWNRYPGCRCDVESLDYSYSFDAELEQEWTWTERYPSQLDVERYLNHVADRFGLRPDIQLNTRVTAVRFDEADASWVVETDRRDSLRARFCVLAVGCLSARNLPQIPGIESFEGSVLHTGAWPADGVDFSGQQVGVIGTGSSGVQVIPLIAEQARHLFVFQRTPHFVVPAHNRPLSTAAVDERKAVYPSHRQMLREGFFGFTLALNPQSALDITDEERQEVYEAAWREGGPILLGTFGDLLVNRAANDTAANFVRGKIASIVRDPETAVRLMPTDYPIGAKRLVQGTDYYETYNRDDVTLVDVRGDPIRKITHRGLATGSARYELDAIVCATGYDAVTGAILAVDVRGRDGLSLRDRWAHGPRAYLGIAIAGFPNLFVITGPGSPSVVSNVVLSIEQHVEWIAGCIDYLRAHDRQSIEATEDAEAAWMDHVDELAAKTLFPTANSWYVGANIPGKPRVFMAYLGGVGAYRRRCDEIASNSYEGFVTRPASEGAAYASA